MSAWLGAFLFTQVVEVPFYRWQLKRLSPLDAWGLSFLLSLATHPVVWFVFPSLVPGSYWGMVLAAESYAVAVEGLILWRVQVPQPFLVSLVANSLSAGLGLFSRSYVGWP